MVEIIITAVKVGGELTVKNFLIEPEDVWYELDSKILNVRVMPDEPNFFAFDVVSVENIRSGNVYRTDMGKINRYDELIVTVLYESELKNNSMSN